MDIKPIETSYKGYRFRSRLEARWAVFLDALDVKWEYEKEGFELPSGRYLPDFWIQDWKIWIEIKPDIPTNEEYDKAKELCAGTGYGVFVSWGLPRDTYHGNFFCHVLYEPGFFPPGNQGIYTGDPEEDLKYKAELLAELATPRVGEFLLGFTFGYKDEYTDVWLIPQNPEIKLLYYRENNKWHVYKYRKPFIYSSYDAEWTSWCAYDINPWKERIDKYINKAKSARFEHGECG